MRIRTVWMVIIAKPTRQATASVAPESGSFGPGVAAAGDHGARDLVSAPQPDRAEEESGEEVDRAHADHHAGRAPGPGPGRSRRRGRRRRLPPC